MLFSIPVKSLCCRNALPKRVYALAYYHGVLALVFCLSLLLQTVYDHGHTGASSALCLGWNTGADMSAVPPAPQDFDGELVLETFEFDDQDVGLNILIMVHY